VLLPAGERLLVDMREEVRSQRYQGRCGRLWRIRMIVGRSEREGVWTPSMQRSSPGGVGGRWSSSRMVVDTAICYMSAEVETEKDMYEGLVIDTGNVVCSNKLSRILDVDDDDSSTRLQSLDPVNTLPSPVAPTNDIPAPCRAGP